MSDKTSSTTPHAAEITLIESENNGQFADPDFLAMRPVLHSLNAMRKGNFSVRLPTDWVGLEGKIADAFNEIIAANERMAKDLRHVSKVVGKQSRTGQRARFSDTGGAWQGMEDSINSLIGDLAWPTTEVTRTIGAVAKGNLTEAMSLERDGQPLQGEFLRSAKIVNTLIAQLGVFTSEVTRVAREVGTEGKLGGQAQVQDVSGVWKDLTANVNLLAANLTTQVRAIAEVATAVTKGDLTRSIQVDARGEVAELKDNLNAMISNLRGTTDQNTEQDWLKTNLAKFTRNMQGQRELATVGQMLLSELAVLVNAQHGVIYQMEGIAHDARLRLLAGYAMHGTQELGHEFRLGEGLVGQCAFEKRRILLNEVPEDYVRIGSALGHAIPQCVIVLPVLFEGQVKAVIELASLAQFTQTHLTFLTQLTESLGIVLNTLEATMRTEGLLQRSQKLTAELQTQQTELLACI